MNPIRNPFSRDEYPALTDAINGVVNGQPRPVEDPITEDAMTAERDAELRGKMKREKDYGEYRKLRAQREKEAKSKKKMHDPRNNKKSFSIEEQNIHI